MRGGAAAAVSCRSQVLRMALELTATGAHQVEGKAAVLLSSAARRRKGKERREEEGGRIPCRLIPHITRHKESVGRRC